MHLATVVWRKNVRRDRKVLRFKPAISIMLGENHNSVHWSEYFHILTLNPVTKQKKRVDTEKSCKQWMQKCPHIPSLNPYFGFFFFSINKMHWNWNKLIRKRSVCKNAPDRCILISAMRMQWNESGASQTWTRSQSLTVHACSTAAVSASAHYCIVSIRVHECTATFLHNSDPPPHRP